MRKDEVGWYKTLWGEEGYCLRCHSDVQWEECDACGGEGFSHHDCGEDTCCCLDPVPNVECDVCDGEGGWYICLGCNQSVCNCEPYPEDKQKLKEAAHQNGQIVLSINTKSGVKRQQGVCRKHWESFADTNIGWSSEGDYSR